MEIKVTGNTPVELIKAVSQFSQLPSECGKCKSNNLGFRHRVAGQSNEYDYLTLTCNDCGASLDLGMTKVGEGIFPKFNNDKVGIVNGFYKWQDQDYAGGGSNARQTNPSNPPVGGDDIPF